MVMGWNSRLLGPLALAGEPAETPAGSAGLGAAPPAPASLLESWFRDHFTRLWRLVARLGVPSAGTADVVPDTFITARPRHADIAEARVRPFLVGTAVRLAANQRKRAAARREVTQAEVLDAQASSLPDAEQLLQEKR